MKKRSSNKPSGGFSLVEIAIIMVIIGLIVGTVIPRLIKVIQQESVKETKTDIQNSRDEIIGYVLAKGCFMPDDTAECESIIAHRKDKWNNNFYCEIPTALDAADVVNFVGSTGMSVQVGSSPQEDEIAYLVGSRGRNGVRDLGFVSPFLIQPYDESGNDDIVEYVAFSYLQGLCTGGVGGDEGDVVLGDDSEGFDPSGGSIPDPGGAGGSVEVGDFDGDGEIEIKLFDDDQATNPWDLFGSACLWYQGSSSESYCDNTGICPFTGGLRAYFKLRVGEPDGIRNLHGVTFAVLGSGDNLYGTTNATEICGGPMQDNGYGANNQDMTGTYSILAPKIGVEFDLAGSFLGFGNTLGTPGDPQPNHMGIIYWATDDQQPTNFFWGCYGFSALEYNYDDVVHGYGQSVGECQPLRADKIGFEAFRMPNPGTTSPAWVSVPDGEVGSFPWLEDNMEHQVRVEVQWDKPTRQLTTTAWIGGPGTLNIPTDITSNLTGFTCTAPDCRMVTDTATIPSGMEDYMDGIRFGWTFGSLFDGEAYIEGFKIKFIP